MAVVPIPITGSRMVQADLAHANVVYSDQEGVLYNPSPEEVFEQDMHFKHTYAPPLNSNFAWNSVKLDWTRSYTNTPTVFEALFTLEGILLDGTIELLAEKIIPTITDTPVTETVSFDLKNGRSTPSISKVETETATSGKVEVNLPKRWLYFTDMVLNRAWLVDWSKRKKVPITLTTPSADYVLRRVAVTYDADMQSDFSDIRFTSPGGRTIFCSERESYTASTSAVFNVLIPAEYSDQHVYMYYGNATATLHSDPFTIFSEWYYDDFEDNKYTGRASPYRNWVPTAGTISINNSSLVDGTYSLQHTGPGAGTFYDYSAAVMTDTLDNYLMSYKFRLTSQGTYANTPRVTLAVLRYTDSSHYLVVDSYYDGTNQKLRVVECNGGSSYIKLSPVTWMAGKIPTGTTYDIKIIDTGAWFTLNIDGVNYFNQAATSTETNGLKGMGCNNDSVAVFDSIRISPYHGTPGTLGGEESTITVDPDTATEDDLSLLFTLPADWSTNSPSNLQSTELNHSLFETNDLLVSDQDVLELSPNNVDRFQALRTGVYVKADRNCNLRFENLEYSYEVI